MRAILDEAQILSFWKKDKVAKNGKHSMECRTLGRTSLRVATAEALILCRAGDAALHGQVDEEHFDLASEKFVVPP